MKDIFADLSTRARNLLRMSKISDLDALCDAIEQGWLVNTNNLGRKTEMEIKEFLQCHGILVHDRWRRTCAACEGRGYRIMTRGNPAKRQPRSVMRDCRVGEIDKSP